jgi:hypothetical protein
VTNAARAAALLALALTGCAGGPAASPDRGGIRVLDAMPDGAVVLRDYEYTGDTYGLMGALPMEYARRYAEAAGADAIVVVEESTDWKKGRQFLRVKFVRIPK